MAKSTYLINNLLNVALRATAYTTPTTVYVALYTSNPTIADTGTEVTGGSYARQAVTFAAPSAGAVANSAALTFTNMPAATITHIGIRDALTLGNLLHFAPATASKVTNVGDTVTVAVSAISVSES